MEQNQKPQIQKRVIIVLAVLVVLLALAFAVFATPLKDRVLPAKAEPAVTLAIVEGPTLLEAEGVYEFIVEASVTGKPKPEVVFNRDDSMGAQGPMRVSILLKEEESFLLTAVARNALGETSATLELTADDSLERDDDGDEEEAEPNRPPVVSGLTFSEDTLEIGETYAVTAAASDPDGDPLTYFWQVSGGSVTNASTNPITWTTPSVAGNYQVTVTVRDGRGGETTAIQEVAVTEPPSGNGIFVPDPIVPLPFLLTDSLPPVPGESGTIIKDTHINLYYIFVGDSSTNKIIRGFISFDIGSLAGKTVHSAELRLAEPYVNDDPSFMHGTSGSMGLRLNIAYWGARPLELDDYNLPGSTIEAYTDYDITHTSVAGKSSSKLVDFMQYRIDNGFNRFQIRLFFAHEYSDNDGVADYVRYQLNNIILKVTYTQPAF